MRPSRPLRPGRSGRPCTSPLARPSARPPAGRRGARAQTQLLIEGKSHDHIVVAASSISRAPSPPAARWGACRSGAEAGARGGMQRRRCDPDAQAVTDARRDVRSVHFFNGGVRPARPVPRGPRRITPVPYPEALRSWWRLGARPWPGATAEGQGCGLRRYRMRRAATLLPLLRPTIGRGPGSARTLYRPPGAGSAAARLNCGRAAASARYTLAAARARLSGVFSDCSQMRSTVHPPEIRPSIKR